MTYMLKLMLSEVLCIGHAKFGGVVRRNFLDSFDRPGKGSINSWPGKLTNTSGYYSPSENIF